MRTENTHHTRWAKRSNTILSAVLSTLDRSDSGNRALTLSLRPVSRPSSRSHSPISIHRPLAGGLAFVISPNDETLGDAGGFLGLLKADDPASGFVAVEFDTLMDVEFEDINGNHVGLDLNSMVSTHVGDLESVEIDLKSGNLVNAWIEYYSTTKAFSIWVSYSNLKSEDPLLSFNLDLDQYVSDFMYVGFSGSIQGSTEVHSIEWWSFRRPSLQSSTLCLCFSHPTFQNPDLKLRRENAHELDTLMKMKSPTLPFSFRRQSLSA